jgi:sulfofructose kinase
MKSSRARVLCAGIAVEDFIFRVDRFPTPSTKAAVEDFVVTGGGCAANAAIAIARLGGQARFAGPLGDDARSERIVEGMARAGVDVAQVTRVVGGVASLSGIFVDAAGERLLATRREQGLRAARASDPEALLRDIAVVLADNHFPEFVLPVCEAARARGAFASCSTSIARRSRLILCLRSPRTRSSPRRPCVRRPASVISQRRSTALPTPAATSWR